MSEICPYFRYSAVVHSAAINYNKNVHVLICSYSVMIDAVLYVHVFLHTFFLQFYCTENKFINKT